MKRTSKRRSRVRSMALTCPCGPAVLFMLTCRGSQP